MASEIPQLFPYVELVHIDTYTPKSYTDGLNVCFFFSCSKPTTRKT